MTRHFLRETRFLAAKQKQQIDRLTVHLTVNGIMSRNQQIEENLMTIQTAEKVKLSAQKATSFFKTSFQLNKAVKR